jgi:hypothetical protein
MEVAKDVPPEPVALMAPGPILVARVDGRALFDHKSLGPSAITLAERFVRLPAEAGVNVAKDVDRVQIASYAVEVLDACAFVEGRFDTDRLRKTLDERSGEGGTFQRRPVGSLMVYQNAQGALAVLSDKLLLSGTPSALQKVVERFDRRVRQRELAPWMSETLESSGAAFSVAVDLGERNVDRRSLGMLPLAFLDGLKTARIVGRYDAPGLRVDSTLGYTDIAKASHGEQSLGKLLQLAKIMSMGGAVPPLRETKLQSSESRVDCSFALDETSLQSFASNIPGLLGK